AAGSGKSTLARSLARTVHLPYMNTGLMYRALTASAIRQGVSEDDVEGLLDLTRGLRFTLGGSDPRELKVEGFDDRALTTPDVERSVSAVSRHPRIRAWMHEVQRALGAEGAVVEGRGMGSVHEGGDGRGRRASERRQVDPGQSSLRSPSSDRARDAGGDAGPDPTRRNMAWPFVRAGRYRRVPARRARDRGAGRRTGPARDRRGRRDPARGRRPDRDHRGRRA